MDFRDIENKPLHPKSVAKLDQLLAGIAEQQRKSEELQEILNAAIARAKKAEQDFNYARKSALRLIGTLLRKQLDDKVRKLAQSAWNALNPGSR